MSEARKALRDYGLVIAVAIGAALIVRGYLVEAYRVPSPVMSPALLPGDTIFVAKWPYAFGARRLPTRGEIVVFVNPFEGGADFVRRVAGLPGDRIEIRGGQIWLNGDEAAEGAVLPHCATEQLDTRKVRACWDPDQPAQMKEIVVPDGSVFVVADYRSPIPLDSRKPVGEIVPLQNIKGHVLLIWLSVEPKEERSWFSRIRFDRMFRSV